MDTKTFARKALLTTVLVGSLGGVGAGVASAATTDPVLTATTNSPWGADCSYSARVDWDRNANRLLGNVTIDNHRWDAACRKTAIVTFVDDEGQEIQRRYDIDTAGSVFDPNAPSRLDKTLDHANTVGKRDVPFIDSIRVDIVNRPK